MVQSDAWRLAREAELLEMGELLSKGEVCIGHQDEWRHTVDTLLNSCVDFNVMVSAFYVCILCVLCVYCVYVCVLYCVSVHMCVACVSTW